MGQFSKSNSTNNLFCDLIVDKYFVSFVQTGYILQVLLEVIIWTVGFGFIIFALFSTFSEHFKERNQNMFRSDILLVPLEQVPFPVITVDIGHSLDPMGIVRKSQEAFTHKALTSDCKNKSYLCYLALSIDQNSISQLI